MKQLSNSGNYKPLLISFAILLTLVLGGCNSPQQPAQEQESSITPEGVIHPDWSKNANIYEVNIRQYTPEGTIKAFEEHLPRLREMGIDILWLMPIHPIGEKNRKGTLGSYYSVKDYKAVNSEMGTMDDFKSFVRTAHGMGFKVILDWVANHTAWDNQWIYDHPEWYTKDSTGQMVAPYDWTDVADLNYDEPGLRDAMMDALKFWVAEADIDGYRCDVASEVPTDFWNRARKELDAIKPVFMLAEAEAVDLHEKAFDMTYAWELHHIYNEIAKGKMNAMDVDTYFMKMDTTYPFSAYRMNFITNHDENSWNGTIKERLGDGAEVFAMLSFTLPGMPMLYNGQEVGLDKRLEFFEKDMIKWDLTSQWLPFYSRLIDLKHNNVALWNGEFGSPYERVHTSADDRVLAFVRQKGDNAIFVVANLSGEPVEFEFTGALLKGPFVDGFTGEEIEWKDEMLLSPWGYKLLIKK
ncbi:MAG: alpha-glucosidase C-terminal domain-containing protein [Bacteroidetes bacterium]|nr:alpha-glucosidase C-terminal domain-containing protein [Bacteroidota bacterium]